MARFKQTSEILRLMHNKELIRNVGIVAHIDHGKTTMTDSLLMKAGFLPPQVAGTARALDYLREEQKRGITIKAANISLLHDLDGKQYVINLVDTPGHVDFTGKVTRALRAIDTAIVVVDAVEEIMAQTITVTRQALQERVRPLLFINKIDRLITELRLTAPRIQDKLTHIVDAFNALIETFAEPEYATKWRIDPAENTVAFGSALHRWGFTLEIAEHNGIKFSDVVDAYRNEKQEDLSKLLPLHKAILDMTVKHGPNPLQAQKYRVPKIWKGNLDSEVGKALLNCDENGPAVMCITNTQTHSAEGAIATGRIFSGTLKDGDTVYLVNADKQRVVNKVFLCLSAYLEKTQQMTAGNVAALAGLEAVTIGETAVSLSHKQDTAPFESMAYISQPVMTVAIEPKDPKELRQLSEVLKTLTMEDPNLRLTVSEKTGEYELSGMGELHLETAVHFLKEYAADMKIVISSPESEYRETITVIGQVAKATTAGKQNSFMIQAEPSETRSNKVWASDEHANVLIDSLDGIMIPEEARDAIVQGFVWACKNGPLCEQPLTNVKVKLLEAQVHEDLAVRDPAQIARAVSRAILGSVLTGKPALLEPIYMIELSAPTRWFGACTNIITSRRGKIQSTEKRGDLAVIVGFIPVTESFGLAGELRSATSGHAFWQNTFSHWNKVPEIIASEIIRQIRAKRGLPPRIPKPEKFIDEQ